MTDDRYDDGLVHSHGWATDAPAHLQAGSPQSPPMPGQPDDALPFDDGLVHSHNWATGDYAQPAAMK